MPDGVAVIHVTREELLQRRGVVEAELSQIRSLRTERQCLNELGQIAFLLGGPTTTEASTQDGCDGGAWVEAGGPTPWAAWAAGQAVSTGNCENRSTED